jgi:hypothetical protein
MQTVRPRQHQNLYALLRSVDAMLRVFPTGRMTTTTTMVMMMMMMMIMMS